MFRGLEGAADALDPPAMVYTAFTLTLMARDNRTRVGGVRESPAHRSARVATIVTSTATWAGMSSVPAHSPLPTPKAVRSRDAVPVIRAVSPSIFKAKRTTAPRVTP